MSIASDPAPPLEIAFDDEVEPAGRSRHSPLADAASPSASARLLAWTVDLALLTGLVALHVALAAWLVGAPALAPHGIGSRDYWLDLLLSQKLRLSWAALGACLAVAYSWVFGALGGRTPGMAVAGLRLVAAGGRPPSPGRAFARGMAAVPSAALGLFGFALALFDSRGQTLHEKLSGTAVVAD